MRQEIKDRCTPHVLLIGYLGYFVHLPVSDYSAMLQRARQRVCINERELSALLIFSNLFCMCIAQTDTLSADSADECVCLVRWRDIHNRKAVSSRKVLITFFLLALSFPTFPNCATPKIYVHTLGFYCGLWSQTSTSEELLYYKLNNTEYTILNLLMPPLGLACPCNFLS